ncbi:alpha-l-arabinofuranosidase a [Moniliophthora roreri MCA 2997]|uniref:non-reducing end alpha-L-arabinofuranosidase n=1 Tax=Moniliophthora roreri (strain MCA 2997) TaxID=1381753 RepID=V2YKP0_MONRO|nr:alpha-l-arabinofuranosidase a [Moniliophthora roreri MCA 2997]
MLTLLTLVGLATLASAQSPVWSQCGGIGWSGSTTCASGSSCVVQNPYYSQCLPSSGNPPAAPTTQATAAPAATTVRVSSTASHPIPTTLLLQNRAFQNVQAGSSGALSHWAAVNGGQISVVADAVSSSLKNALSLTIPSGKSGGVGFSNDGWWGMKVTAGSTYKASFYYRFPSSTSFSGNAVVSLQTNGGQVLGSANVALSGSQTTWKKVTASITPTTSASNAQNKFAITIDGAAGSGKTIRFAMLSLFPPTFKNRENGMRADIAQALVDIKPAFFRFPGGNNLEGVSIDGRWKWRQTVGDLIDRPGRQGTWGYYNTDGLGLYDYLLWCEDGGMEPIMAVWAGSGGSGSSVPEDQLGPYVQEAIDQINFVIGDPAKSSAAALRAQLGHPEPFKLQYVEIGNEDFVNPTTYQYRWRAFYNAIHAAFPQLTLIHTDNVGTTYSPKPPARDHHVYQSPSWFAKNTFFYDDLARDGTKYFEGEYAVISTVDSDIWNNRLPYPVIQGAVSEAAYMTGIERNSDIVFAACYAPLLNHVSGTQWSPNLVAYDAMNVVKSASYYVQKLFGNNRGDQYISSTLPARSGALQWSVVKSGSNNIIIKIANTGTSAQTLAFALPWSNVASSASVDVLSANSGASNTPSNPNSIQPTTKTITVGQNFSYDVPGLSLSVIKFTAS